MSTSVPVKYGTVSQEDYVEGQENATLPEASEVGSERLTPGVDVFEANLVSRGSLISNEKLDQLRTLSAVLQCLCLIDLFTSLPWAALNPLGLILLWMPAFGYMGSRQYRTEWISVYFFYLLLQLFLRVFVLVFGAKYLEKHNILAAEFVYTILLVLVNLWIMRLVVNFISGLKSCDATELRALRCNSWRIDETSGLNSYASASRNKVIFIERGAII